MGEMTVMITGATAGFGAASARKFVAEGHKVIATGRRQDRLDAMQAELGADRCCTLAFDVSDRQGCFDAVGRLPDAFSKIDVLVNNAGFALGLEPAHRANLDDWDAMVDTNVKGLMYMARAVLPGMTERKSGLIVNLGSVAGTYPYPGGNVYGGTKAFVHQFSLNLRADLLGTNVRVTSLEPGLAETEFSLVRFKGDSDKAGDVYSNTTPLTPENIADIIYWLATQPPHVNINVLEVMTARQAFSPFAIDRD